MMRISIFGMGYVGAVSAACLAERGHHIVGVDINPQKVEHINAGESPVVEERIGDLIGTAVSTGSLCATTDAIEAVRDTDVSLISVGTPSRPDGSLSLTAIDAVVADIGRAIRHKGAPHTVIVRSTVLPGTTETRIAPMLAEHSGRAVGDGLDVAFNPEFLREGSSVKDFYEPPFTVVGSIGTQGEEVVAGIYRGIEAPLIRTNCQIAESVKYLCNVFHALKITFANEIGSVLKALGVDGREAMQIFCRDHSLNISPAYLRPGYAFGGSCLPKDLRAFLSLASDRQVDLPVLGSVLSSNERHIERAFRMVTAGGRRPVALFGLSFKPGTDDLRESPLVALAERLLGKGYDVKIVDQSVNVGRLIGANRAFIEREIPHLERLLVAAPEEAVAAADVIVVGHAGPAEVDAIAAGAAGRTIVDLQGVPALARTEAAVYEGICW
jgi:GDP-mannose 6-dehydrogenase